jgi:flagellar hook-associated protein 1 FlgK
VGSLFSALNSASSALDAFQRAVDVTQNNVSNVNTIGYAAQVPTFQAESFQSTNGLSGGVVEQTQDTRNQFADTAVQQQLSQQGLYQQLQSSLAPLQNVFDVSSSSAIPSALNQLFQSFSQWSTQPSNANYQTAVISAAQQTATAFQQAAAQLTSIRGATVQDLQSTVAQINQDAVQIQTYNSSVTRQSTADPGAQAQLESTLENLSGLANVQLLSGVGGTVTVLLGGQTPLVIGTQVNALRVQNDATNALNGPPNQSIVDSNGNDVTGQVTSGSLAGLLTAVNDVIPSLAGGGTQVGGLNTLAQGLADTVNNLLAQGSTTATPPYQTGLPLFTYTAGSPAGVAASINVNPALTPSQLAATNPGPPPVSNGIALQLSQLDSGTSGPINGLGPTQYFSTLVSQVGNAVSNASTNATAQTQLVAQAKSLQQQLSGVNLDEEAVRLVQLQSSYQAASKVVTVIDELTQSLMNMVQ